MKIIFIDDADDKKYWKSLERVLSCVVGLRRSIRSINLALAFFKPEMPIFPSSLSSSPGVSLSIPERLMYLPFVVYMICTWWAHISFLSIFVLTYGFSSLDAVQNLR